MNFISLITAFALAFVVTVGVRVSHSLSSTDPILVSLAPAAPEPLKIKLHWGGYYTNITENGSWEVFRLVDISPEGYHVMNFRETFRKMPRMTDIAYLFPDEEVTAREGRDILQRKPVFLGKGRFNPGDLDSYAKFLDRQGNSGHSISLLINRAIKYSQVDPVITKLSLVDNRLNLEPIGL